MAQFACASTSALGSRALLNIMDANLAINVANALFGNAGAFFSRVPNQLNESAAYVCAHRGQLVAAVANLTLALELYLKGIIALSGKKAKKTHSLFVLFEQLPKDIQLDIETLWESMLKSVAKDQVIKYRIGITDRPVPPTEEQERHFLKSRPVGNSIREILKAEENSFTNWRYLHDIELENNAFVTEINFFYLGLFANLLQKRLKSSEPNKSWEATRS